MSKEPKDIQVRVLGDVELTVGGVLTPLPGELLKRLLAELVLSPDGALTPEALLNNVWKGMSRPKANALHRLMSRLRDAGLRDHLPDQSDGRYRLDLPPNQVDAWQLLAVARDLAADRPIDDAALDEAIGLWRGEPAAGTGNGAVRVTRAYEQLVAERRRRHKPRVLIVDDKVGHSISSMLGDFRCTVLTDVDSFWEIADRCEELFDAALVDLHLDPNDSAAGGLAVVASLRKSARLPAVLMTYKPAEGDVTELVSRYNLFGTFIKSSNDPSGNFSKLRPIVEQMTGDGVQEMLVDRADEDLGRSERKARKQIRHSGQGEVAMRKMAADADAVRTKIRAGVDLGTVRRALTEFRQAWLPDDM